MSLQFENAIARKLIQKMDLEAIQYRVEIFEGLYEMGKIKKMDFEWTSFAFLSFGFTLPYKNILYEKSNAEKLVRFDEGVRFFCSQFAGIMEK